MFFFIVLTFFLNLRNGREDAVNFARLACRRAWSWVGGIIEWPLVGERMRDIDIWRCDIQTPRAGNPQFCGRRTRFERTRLIYDEMAAVERLYSQTIQVRFKSAAALEDRKRAINVSIELHSSSTAKRELKIELTDDDDLFFLYALLLGLLVSIVKSPV